MYLFMLSATIIYALIFMIQTIDTADDTRLKEACKKVSYDYKPESGCHKVYKYTVGNWNNSRGVCKKYGADLVVINSKAEAEHLSKKMKEQKIENAWVGIHELNGQWTSVNGKPLNKTGYDHWYFEEMDHAPRKDSCLEFRYFESYQKMGLAYFLCNGAEIESYICEVV